MADKPVGTSVLTLSGLKLLQEATVTGKKINPTKFKVSNQDVELYQGIDTKLQGVWYEARINGYRKINENTVEFILDVPPDKAQDFGRTFGLYTEDGTLLMLAKPPFPFPPLARQTLKVQLTWKSIEEVVDFKYIPTSEYEQHLMDWEAVQYFAEFVRQELSTGIISQPYGRRDPQLPMEEKSVATVGWSVIGIHNHPNYQNMPGLGWFVANANGFLFQTRHNDYRCQKKTAGFLATEYAYAPASPKFSIDQMKDLFSRYLSQSLTDEEKKLFRWDLAYLEAFFVELDSPFDKVEDLFTSFRHALGSQSAFEVAKSLWHQRLSGKKVRFENSALLPFMAKEDGKYVVLLYRILVQPLPQFNGKLWSDIVKPYEEYEINYVDFFSVKKRFEWREEIDLHSIWQLIPGLDGEGAEILSLTSEDGHTIAGGINYAYYHQKFSFTNPDAVNLFTFNEGWNDVTLVVAHTQNPKIYGGVSYLIPLELILRTPLESWNPYRLPYRENVFGNGTPDAPYDGINPRARWFLTPAEFFKSKPEGLTVADTATSPRWVKDSSGTPRLVYPSGVWTVLPEIEGVGRIRTRFPIYWDAHEKGILGHFLSIAKRRLTAAMLEQASLVTERLLSLETATSSLQGHMITLNENLEQLSERTSDLCEQAEVLKSTDEELAVLQLYQAVLNYENTFGNQG